MVATDITIEAAAIDLSRECLYRFLAAAMSDPYNDAYQLIRDPASQQLAFDACALLQEELQASPIPRGFGEMPPEYLELTPLIEEIHKPIANLRSEYDQIFGLVLARECPPYETEYHSSSETFFRSQELADIAGFYRAFGLNPGRETPERPDHLALELEFMAFLLMKKRLGSETPELVEVCEAAEQKFFETHLAWWVPAFANGLRRKAEDGFYFALSRVLAAFIPFERGRLHVSPPRVPVAASLIERPEEQGSCASCTGS
jgi:DMSO reductase family type II enzyme chaperone